MNRAAVLGRPIAHSMSPVLHRAAYAALGLDWSYEAIECGVEELAAVVSARPDWAGFSCTMPLKHAVLAFAAEVRPRATAVGAGNTLLPLPGGGWAADNTDVVGIAQALAEFDVRPGSVAILGAGGTAQAAVVALSETGRTGASVLVRNPDRAAGLLDTAARVGVTLSVVPISAAGLTADLVISTLPAGAADSLAEHAWRPDQVLLDVVYSPWPTPLAAAVARRGGTVISGALMLLHQAAAQVELMTGQPAPVGAMRAALRAAMPRAGL
jgi:shikimate dehydrogenase